MSAMQNIGQVKGNIADRTKDINNFVGLALKGRNNGDVPEINRAITGIQEIVTTSLNQGTVSYGIRVLSKWGYNNGHYNEEQLREMVNDFNDRGFELGAILGAPYHIDPPRIKYFWMEIPSESMYAEGELRRVRID